MLCWQASDSTAALVAWQTCDHSLGEFSPDGQHLAGFASYLDAWLTHRVDPRRRHR